MSTNLENDQPRSLGCVSLTSAPARGASAPAKPAELLQLDLFPPIFGVPGNISEDRLIIDGAGSCADPLRPKNGALSTCSGERKAESGKFWPPKLEYALAFVSGEEGELGAAV